MQKYLFRISSILALFFLASCETNQIIVNNISEREANEIVVYLASKGIEAQKTLIPSTGVGAPTNQYMIMVSSDRSVDAIAVLNKIGLPRRQGQTLLELFAKSGLISSTLEETVRYQAGLAEELKNTIRKIDGVLDVDVQISFPNVTAAAGGAGGAPAPGAPQQKITAAVYVKHLGVLEDPNSHIEVKIKRLMAGSVSGLSYDDVAVISDRSRFADITLTPEGEPIGSKAIQTHVSIWGLVMTQSSIGRFRFIFFVLIILLLLSLSLTGWLVYRFFPYFRIPFVKKNTEPSLPELPPRT